MKLYQTKWTELQFGNVKGVVVGIPGRKPFKCSDWRFFNEGQVVGPIYPTKQALVLDMPRYALDAWGLE